MSYNLCFDSLASYRLLERKSFSVRTLNLLSRLPAPGSLSDASLVSVTFVPFVPIREHPSSVDAVPFSRFSLPLLSSRPPCPYPLAHSSHPLLTSLLLFRLAVTHWQNPSSEASHPLSDKVTSQRITSDCEPQLW